MPSTQSPPLIGLATDPTAIRPPIDDATIERVEVAGLLARLQALKEEGYTMLLDLGGVDYPGREPRFELVYHLLAMPLRKSSVKETGAPKRYRLLCGVPAENVSVPSVTSLWLSADWAEREIYDLFGIIFEGHPDLRRIQMPDTWEGHPLRKDYPLRGPAQEKSPRPAFALKSNVASGTPPSGRTLEALQAQIAKARGSKGAHGEGS